MDIPGTVCGGVIMCPQCGKRDSVLQSVLAEVWECRPELEGCGAIFEMNAAPPSEHLSTVEGAIKTMTDAIRSFEHQEHPLGQESLVEMERRTAELLDILKAEIERLMTICGE